MPEHSRRPAGRAASSTASSTVSGPPGEAATVATKGRTLPERQPRSRFSDEYGVLLRLLIEARESAGITQAEVARHIGKTQSHVSMCENREREISIMDLWRWCEALGISVSEFMSRFESAVQRDSSECHR